MDSSPHSAAANLTTLTYGRNNYSYTDLTDYIVVLFLCYDDVCSKEYIKVIFTLDFHIIRK